MKSTSLLATASAAAASFIDLPVHNDGYVRAFPYFQ